MGFESFLNWLNANCKEPRITRTLGRRVSIKVELIENGRFLLIEYSKNSQLCCITMDKLKLIFDRYFALGENKHVTSKYSDPEWQNTPNRICAPYAAALIRDYEIDLVPPRENISTSAPSGKQQCEDKVMLLIKYITNLSGFNIVGPDISIPYNHMGATIIDAILQAGTTWITVVKPRIQKILNYQDAETTTGFLQLMEKEGKVLLNWSDDEKPSRIRNVASFFKDNGIETETDLKTWLEDDENATRLKKLRGIGNKTIDYLKILAGISTSAVDRHLINFLKEAGIKVGINEYFEAQKIINKTAESMGIKKSILDHSLWYYMSTRKKDGPLPKPPIDVGHMPKKGDIFKGKINDLSLWDASGWRRRDIWFFKHELNRNQKFSYPDQNQKIILKDKEGHQYSLNFSKPETDDKVCLGTPGKLKPWYQKKSYNDKAVGSNEWVYFKYTGVDNEFYIFTDQEYKLNSK